MLSNEWQNPFIVISRRLFLVVTVGKAQLRVLLTCLVFRRLIRLKVKRSNRSTMLSSNRDCLRLLFIQGTCWCTRCLAGSVDLGEKFQGTRTKMASPTLVRECTRSVAEAYLDFLLGYLESGAKYVLGILSTANRFCFSFFTKLPRENSSLLSIGGT